MNLQDPLQLEKIVKRATWKEILISMINEGKVDPWDIDLTVLIDGFMEKIKEMESVELTIPGNVVLATAILLRYKSDAIIMEEEEESVEMEPEVIPVFEKQDVVPVARIQPKRPITMDELINHVERVMEKVSKPVVKPLKKSDVAIPSSIEKIAEISFNINQAVEQIWQTLRQKKHTTFDVLCEGKGRLDKVRTLFALLVLFKEGDVDLKQDSEFGPIEVIACEE